MGCSTTSCAATIYDRFWRELVDGCPPLLGINWLGRLFAASILRQAGVTTGVHLAAINLELKTISVNRRRHRDRESRLLAIAHGILAAAEIGMKEHDRLVLARTLFERKLEGRRTSSQLPELVELVMAKPLASAGMVAKTLEITPQAARRIVTELGLREMTGRGQSKTPGANSNWRKLGGKVTPFPQNAADAFAKNSRRRVGKAEASLI